VSPTPIGDSSVGRVRALRAAVASSRVRAPTEAVSSDEGPSPELLVESLQPPRAVINTIAVGKVKRGYDILWISVKNFL
jgi:hypothetical protein